MDDTNRGWRPPVAPSLDTVTRFEHRALPLLDSLYSAARQLTGNAAEADDLVADTYMHAFLGFDQLADDANPREWLFRILNSRYVDRRRRRARPPVHAAVPKLRDTASARDNSVKKAMRALPEHCRMAVYLADVEGFSYRDIAGITGTTVTTVTSRLNRARARLRELLVNRRTW